MEIRAKVKASRGLTWAIRQATGLNLGGYVEIGGIAQTGSIQTFDEGTRLILPDSTLPAIVATLQAILDFHDPRAPLPADFPPDPKPSRLMDEKAQFAAATIEEKISLLAKREGLA